MMSGSITIGKEYGYVAAAAVASFFVHHLWMNIQVVKARKQYGVKYPALYATREECSDEKARNNFNCVQRAHQNSLENQPVFLALLILGGLKFGMSTSILVACMLCEYPITSAAFGALYLVGRIVFFAGYSTGDPSGRYRGAFLHLAMFGLVGTVGKMAFDLLTQ